MCRIFTQYTLHLAREETEQEVFLFLLGEKPKMATNAHPRVADLHNTHYILPERRQNREVFLFSIRRKTQDGDQCTCCAD
jgi:hypothetical protein